jgi:hypothetical protein
MKCKKKPETFLSRGQGEDSGVSCFQRYMELRRSQTGANSNSQIERSGYGSSCWVDNTHNHRRI